MSADLPEPASGTSPADERGEASEPALPVTPPPSAMSSPPDTPVPGQTASDPGGQGGGAPSGSGSGSGDNGRSTGAAPEVHDDLDLTAVPVPAPRKPVRRTQKLGKATDGNSIGRETPLHDGAGDSSPSSPLPGSDAASRSTAKIAAAATARLPAKPATGSAEGAGSARAATDRLPALDPSVAPTDIIPSRPAGRTDEARGAREQKMPAGRSDAPTPAPTSAPKIDRDAPTLIQQPGQSLSDILLSIPTAGSQPVVPMSDHPPNESIAGFVSATRGVSADVDLTNPARPDWKPPTAKERRGARYLGIEEIARGGMGSIRVGFDRDLRREVAMKVILGGSHAPNDKQARFLEEAQVTGQLEHPNIVPVHDLGIAADGSLFFTMKLVRGESLLEVIQKTRDHDAGHERHFTLPRMLQIFLKCCDAVAFAHSRGVIHRDLKPENVMVGGYGEVLVMDWGLSKVMGRPDDVRSRLDVTSDRSEEGLVQTHAGSIVGTPGHMPPEQARGELENLDERSDIYALGCLLYEILTFEPPFPGNDVPKLIKLVRRGRFDPPTRRAPERNIPRELEEVVMRSMAFRKEDRYQTVRDLSAEIERYLDGRTLTSVSYTPSQLFGKWIRRNMKAAVVAVVLLVMSTLLGGYAVWSAIAERDAARNEVADLRAEIAARDAVPRGMAAPDVRLALRRTALLSEADAAIAKHDTGLATLRLRQAASMAPQDEQFRALAWRLDGMLDTRLKPMRTGDAIICMAVDPQRQLMLAGASNGRVMILDLRENAREQTAPVIQHNAAVTAVCFAGDSIVIGDEDGNLSRRTLDGTELERQPAGGRAIRNLMADATSLMVTDSIGRLTLWPLPFCRSPRAMRFASQFRFTAIAAGERLIAYGTDAGVLEIALPEQANRFLATLPTSLGVIRRVRIGPGDATLVALGDAGVGVFDIDRDPESRRYRLNMRYRLEPPHATTRGLTLDAEGRIWTGTDGGFDSFAATSGSFLAHHTTDWRAAAPGGTGTPAAPASVTHLEATTKGMVGLDSDGRLWLLTERPAPQALIVPELGGPCRLAVSRDGGRVLMTDGSAVVVFDHATGWQPQRLITPSRPAAVAFSPDGRRAYIACADGQLLVYSGSSSDQPLPIEPDAERRRPLGWDLIDTAARGASRLLVHVGGRELFFVAAEARVTRVVLNDAVGAVGALTAETMYSRVGPPHAGPVAVWSSIHRLLFRPGNTGIDVLGAEDGALQTTLPLPADPAAADGAPAHVTALALAPGSPLLLAADANGRVHALTGNPDAPATWTVVWTLDSASARAIEHLVVDPESHLLLTADADGEVRVWRLSDEPGTPPMPRGTLVAPGLPHGATALALVRDAADNRPHVWYPRKGSGSPFASAPADNLLGKR